VRARVDDETRSYSGGVSLGAIYQGDLPARAENPRAHHSKASKGVEKSYSEIGDYLYSRSAQPNPVKGDFFAKHKKLSKVDKLGISTRKHSFRQKTGV